MTRGTSIGVYSTAGSLGGTVSPIILGLVADIWGLAMVLRLASVLALIGVLAILYLYTRRGTPLGQETTTTLDKL